MALSYVWGDAKQDIPDAGKQDTKLGKLPQTIEDALTLVKAMGKEYLWVDSICISTQAMDTK